MLETPKASYTFRTTCDIIIDMFGRENYEDGTMDNQQERFELDLAWLAGIIEGEGWVSLAIVRSLQKNKKYYPAFLPNIGVVNTDEKLMSKVEEIFNNLKLVYRKQTRESYIGSDNISRKKKWELSVASRINVINLANAILPYMYGVKKERILKLFDFYKVRDTKPKNAGRKSTYGPEEYEIYKSLYSYKGKSRSKILNDYTLNTFEPKSEDIV